MMRALDSARRIYDEWSPIQRGFFWLGLIQLAVAVAHTVAFLVVGGSLEGPLSFRKPILFAQSFGLVSLSFAFIFHDLGLPGRSVVPLGWVTIAMSAMEVGLASLQFWRGVPSHFNYSTMFNSIVAITMTSGAIAFAGFLLAVTILCWREELSSLSPARQSVRYGIRLALPLALGGLTVIGLIMLANGGEAWRGSAFLNESMRSFEFGRYNGQAAGLRGGGSMMVIHALGTHVLQVLPLAGWLAWRSGLPEKEGRAAITAVAIYYALLMITVALPVFGSQASLRDVGLLTASIIALACAGLLFSFGRLVYLGSVSCAQSTSRSSW